MTKVYNCICPYRSQAQIEARGQEDKSLIVAGFWIVPGSRTGVCHDRYITRSTRLRAKLGGNLS